MEAVETTRCRYCQSENLTVELTPNLPHYGKEVCLSCNRHLRWIPKPEQDRVKRPAAHTDLVRKYSRGFCEMCGKMEADLPDRQTLEANHIIEFQDGGDPGRENVSIICTRCHKLIHLLRTWC